MRVEQKEGSTHREVRATRKTMKKKKKKKKKKRNPMTQDKEKGNENQRK